jgi:Protein of unknown function (DUF2786)
VATTAGQRRAARERREQERPGRRTDEVRQLVIAVARTRGADLDAVAARLVLADPDVDADGAATALLLDQVRLQWERGWQPIDLVRFVERVGSTAVARLVAGLVALEAEGAEAAARAPQEWIVQLREVGALDAASRAPVRVWRRREGLGSFDAWRGVLAVVDGFAGSPERPQLLPPPSRWSSTARRPPTTGSAAGARVLGRIRGLLAKAESTEFPEEAEALSAKAQELMTRYAVDEALLAAGNGRNPAGEVTGRRIPVDNPYPEAKVHLLTAVGQANGVKVVWERWLGIATLVGLPSDLQAVELLYTSLLLQVSRAVTDAGRTAGAAARSVRFRRAFLLAYAGRIAERLAEARDEATTAASRETGADLVPVLRERSEAVDAVFADWFPQVRSAGQRRVDAGGWYAGRAAADRADLGTGGARLPGTGTGR